MPETETKIARKYFANLGAAGADGAFSLADKHALKSESDNPKPLIEEELRRCWALAHGMPAQYAAAAIARGELWSGMRREGPSGRYSRASDAAGGGAAAVYARGIMSCMKGWNAGGHGVGSGDNRIQLLVDPSDVLPDDNTWRCSSTDNMGWTPGSKAAKIASGEVEKAWGCQSRKGRNSSFRDLGKTGKEAHNNEFMFWEKLDLRKRVIAVIFAGAEAKSNAGVMAFLADPAVSLGTSHCANVTALATVSPSWEIKVGGSTSDFAPVYHIPLSTTSIVGWLKAEATRRHPAG